MAEADDDDGSHHFLHLPPPPPSPSPMRRRATSDTAANGGCGEIVEVQGGHIVRSTGRKDRHSKVCTAKGPRDRRVRLSAHTAIQFYDVQDRLGFDRPSKAVDWLIKKAKTSIDELAELPPWNPADAIRLAAANAKPRRTVAKSKISPSPPPPQNLQFCGGFEGGRENPSFMPATMESDSISETMKSFFPVVAEAPSSQIMHNQDLSLSLQSFPGDAPPSLLHHHHNHSAAVAEPALFYGQSNQLGFDTSTVGWEQQSSEFGRIQRLVAWNGGETGNIGGGGGGGGFVFAPPPTSYQPILGQSQQLYSQRGPLQSSYTPMIRAWFDHPNHHHHHHQSISADDIHHHHNIHHIPPQVQQAAIPGMRFASGEFSSGFRVPARFQGQEEELEDGLTNKPSSVSRH